MFQAIILLKECTHLKCKTKDFLGQIKAIIVNEYSSLIDGIKLFF